MTGNIITVVDKRPWADRIGNVHNTITALCKIEVNEQTCGICYGHLSSLNCDLTMVQLPSFGLVCAGCVKKMFQAMYERILQPDNEKRCRIDVVEIPDTACILEKIRYAKNKISLKVIEIAADSINSTDDTK